MNQKTIKQFLLFIFIATCFVSVARANQSLSPKAYEAIQEAQTLSTQKKYKEALMGLDFLLTTSPNAYERAFILQQQAFIWSQQQNYTKATTLLKKILMLSPLPEELKNNVLFSLAQVYVADKKYKEAIKILLAHIKQKNKPSGQVLALVAQAFALLEEYEKAIPYAKRAVASSARPDKSWLGLLAGLYITQKRYRDALTIAKRGAALYPREKIFWRQLVGLYAEFKEERNLFTSLHAMFELGLLERSDEWTRLARSYLSFNAPLQAARVLEEGFRQGLIKPTEKNYQLLGEAWLLAREAERALKPLEKAAALSARGRIWLKLGEGYMEAQAWQKAEHALEQALKKDKVSDKEEGRAWLLLGLARFRQGKREQSFAALTRAIEFDSISSEAKAWLDSLRAK